MSEDRDSFIPSMKGCKFYLADEKRREDEVQDGADPVLGGAGAEDKGERENHVHGHREADVVGGE